MAKKNRWHERVHAKISLTYAGDNLSNTLRSAPGISTPAAPSRGSASSAPDHPASTPLNLTRNYPDRLTGEKRRRLTQSLNLTITLQYFGPVGRFPALPSDPLFFESTGLPLRRFSVSIFGV